MVVKQHTKLKILIAFGMILILAVLMLIALSGGNLRLIRSLFILDLTNEEMKELLTEFGWRGYIVISAMSMLQVTCTFLPAEPIQVISGITFSFPVGLACCMAGIILGNTLIFLLQKSYGDSLRHFFIKNLNLDLSLIAQSNKITVIIFALYFLPAIPYGMICFLAASLGMRYRRYIVVTVLGSLPSACIGVGLGYLTIMSDWRITVGIFALLILVAVGLFLKREALFDWLHSYALRNKSIYKNRVRPVNGFLMHVLYYAVRAYLFLCGVKLKTESKVEPPEGPAIVLCNHGSFIDFIYAAAVLRKCKPHFVVARLYFYNTCLGWLLRNLGAFPKSMFAVDVENAKNCLTVLRNREVLVMMPEARLSTTGRFEDIQSNTYSFIKKAGVNVYTVKIRGDYLADPKWGKGFRRGALVEAELDLLYTAQQLPTLSPEQMKEGIRQRLDYHEFRWLEQHPRIRYRSKRLAEGLENILTVCPVCGEKYTLTTEKNRISCRHCGLLTRLDDRYGFDAGFRFKDLTQWYDWQKGLMEEEIAGGEDYTLSSPVELRLPGTGRGLTRHGGFGTCTLSREGLTYTGTRDGENVAYHFSLQRIYRLLFGAGVNFEIYNGIEILFFVPEEKRAAVDWYMASMILHDRAAQ